MYVAKETISEDHLNHLSAFKSDIWLNTGQKKHCKQMGMSRVIEVYKAMIYNSMI